MGRVKRLALAAALVSASPAPQGQVADPMLQWRAYIAEASLRFGVPRRWIERVVRAESGGNTTLNGRPIRSRAGAIGLMQLMPGTWAAMQNRLRLGGNPDDPHDNIVAGTAYLRLLYDRFGYPGLFAAYNAGPARWAAYLNGKGALPGETVRYLGRVASVPGEQNRPPIQARSSAIFVEIGRENSDAAVKSSSSPAIFVSLNSAQQDRR